MAFTELQNTLRRNVIESLQTIASREEQLEYQRRVPIAYVSAELFCMWGDDSYSEDLAKEEYFRSAFSPSELTAMAEFNQVFERVLHSMSGENLPPIEEFVLTPGWAELSTAATVALRFFNESENTKAA